MKGVILAGGRGTRLFPLTKVTSKHLLPLGREPMLFHLVTQMKSAAINDILIITSTEHMGDVVSCLGSGESFGCNFTYKVQESASGIAHALALAEGFAAGEKICVILGDNVFEYSIAPYADDFRKQDMGARVLLKKVGDPERYGVAALDEHQIIEIEEKPKSPKSSYAVIGLYFFDHKLFDIIRSIVPSERGELEITSVNKFYLDEGLLEFSICKGRWTDAGTFESMLEANQLMFEIGNEIINYAE